jgi:ABC-type polysaccharide/polyol phosphate export permease
MFIYKNIQIFFLQYKSQILIFAHNLLIVVLVLLFYPPPLSWQLLLAPLGIFMIAINGIWLGILLGLLCTRFRDVSQIVGSLIQIMFFLTPIMWKVEMLGRFQWTAMWNPLYHFLEIVRGPLVGNALNTSSWMAVLGITVAGFAIAIVTFGQFRNRIAYWV